MKEELAKRQICRTLAEYSGGLSRGQLYARIECSISYKDFTAALADLEREQLVETGDDERVRIIPENKTRAAEVAA